MLTVQDVDALICLTASGLDKMGAALASGEAPLEQPAAEELPPDITAGVGQPTQSGAGLLRIRWGGCLRGRATPHGGTIFKDERRPPRRRFCGASPR